MKKIWIALICAGCAAGTLAAGIGWNAAVRKKGDARNQDVIRVTMILPHSDQGYWSSVGEGALRAGKELGVDVKLEIPQFNYDISQMTELIHKATAAQVDAIMVQGTNDQEYLEALEEAVASNIQVIFVDTDVEGFEGCLYVGTDNYEAGALLGQKTAEMTEGNANIVVISGSLGYPNLEERYDGFQDILSQYPGMNILTVAYDQYDAIRFRECYYGGKADYPEADTLVCLEGTGGLTMGASLNSMEKIYSRIFAFDWCEEAENALQADFIDGLLVQQQEYMGYLCVEQAKEYCETGRYPETSVLTGTTWLTKEDLDEDFS